MDQTATVLNNFSKNIQKKWPNAQIKLFGSRANGTAFNESDFDIVVISDHFASTPFILRGADILEYWDENYDIDLVCYTTNEYERKKTLFEVSV